MKAFAFDKECKDFQKGIFSCTYFKVKTGM